MRLHVAHVEAKWSGFMRISGILVCSGTVVLGNHFFFFGYSNLPSHLTGKSSEGEAGGVLNGDG